MKHGLMTWKCIQTPRRKGNMDGQSGSDVGQGNAGVDDSSDDGRFQFQHVKTWQPYCISLALCCLGMD